MDRVKTSEENIKIMNRIHHTVRSMRHMLNEKGLKWQIPNVDPNVKKY